LTQTSKPVSRLQINLLTDNVNPRRQPGTRVADDFRAVFSPQQQQQWARYAEAEAACIFVSYGVKPGDVEALASATAQGKRPSLVGIRIYHGDLQFTSVGLAAEAIAGGWATLYTSS